MLQNPRGIVKPLSRYPVSERVRCEFAWSPSPLVCEPMAHRSFCRSSTASGGEAAAKPSRAAALSSGTVRTVMMILSSTFIR